MLWAIAFLPLIYESAAVVDCRLACRRCRQKSDLPEMLEVYCAMCTECKERRVERMHTATATAPTSNTDCEPMQEIADCPEPSCEHLEQPRKVPLKKVVSTTTSTSTTRRPCPSTPCKKPAPCFCMPFLPVAMCPCPAPSQVTQAPSNQKLLGNEPDYSYVYVGVPKDLVHLT